MSELITLQGITKEYQKRGSTVAALRDVSMTIAPGEMIAVWGPSGSGKSTLLNILGTLDVPSRGQYLLEGKPVERMTDQQLSRFRARKIGFIFQSFNLLENLSAVDNVMLPARYAGSFHKSAVRERALELLDLVGLNGRAGHLPGELSGGEEQRVAIARALINDPELILADEPTGNLDSKNHRDVLDLLLGLNQTGKTIAIVSHNPEVAEAAKRVITLKDGTVVEDMWH